MLKRIDPILPILLMAGFWAIVLSNFGGPGSSRVDIWALKGLRYRGFRAQICAGMVLGPFARLLVKPDKAW